MSKREQQTVIPTEVEPLPGGIIERPEPAALSGPDAPPDGALKTAAVTPAAQAFLDTAKGQREVPRKIPLIQIDHKAGVFVLPSGELTEEVGGYPIFYFHTRRFYKKSPVPGQKGMPPDCFSVDNIQPSVEALDRQNETCMGCPQNEFGSARDGRSKACGTRTHLFLLNGEYGEVPIAMLDAGPSNLRTLIGNRFKGGYFSQCVARHQVYEIVWTTFSLRRASDIHCVLEPRMGAALTDVKKVEHLAEVRNQFVEAMNEMRGATGAASVDDGTEG